MRTLLISYDLNNAGKDYTTVIAYIKSIGAWAKPLRSQWLVRTTLEPADVTQGLRLHGADQDDSLLVIDVTNSHAAWSNLSPDVANWIRDNI